MYFFYLCFMDSHVKIVSLAKGHISVQGGGCEYDSLSKKPYPILKCHISLYATKICDYAVCITVNFGIMNHYNSKTRGDYKITFFPFVEASVAETNVILSGLEMEKSKKQNAIPKLLLTKRFFLAVQKNLYLTIQKTF